MFKSKDIVPLKPDRLWRVELGVVRSLTWDEEGRAMTLGFWGKGDVVGRPLSQMSPYQIECLTPVQMSEVGLESRDLHQALLVHAWKSEELLSIVHHPVVYDRLLQLLKWLARHFGQPIPEGILLNLRLTHQDFADTIATTRVTVTRVLNQLERNGMIERCRASEVLSHLKHEPLARQSVILKMDMASCSEAV